MENRIGGRVMKKNLLAVVVLICVCVGLCGCNNQKKINTYLQSGEYLEAYNLAEDSQAQEAIIAENFLAYACYDININVDSDITLIRGSFGQAIAKTTDAYSSNDPISAISNYEKLAEYVSFLSGTDVLNEYYYGVLEITADGNKFYCLTSINVNDNVYHLKYVWETLDQTASDGDVDALYKYVARYIINQGTSIDNSAVKRINEKYLTDMPESVEFKFDLK